MAVDLRKDHHFVPRSYLKRWASPSGRVWVYRTLVSHPNVPRWKESSLRGLAYHSHLYTRVVGGTESDEFERWLDREFESPAEEALNKATSGARMSPADWKRIIRFAVAQDIRTPARLFENIKRWKEEVPAIIEESLQASVREAEQTGAWPAKKHAAQHGRGVKEEHKLPVRVRTELKPGAPTGSIRAEIGLGRQFWIYQMRHILENTIKKVPDRNWTILRSPEGIDWFTSDDPVLRLNYYNERRYDFQGGWGNPGTEIIFPLSPRFLLYTQVGKRPPSRGEEVSLDKAKAIRALLAERAHQMIFAATRDQAVPRLRPRIENPEAFRKYRELWERWHDEQSEAERGIGS